MKFTTALNLLAATLSTSAATSSSNNSSNNNDENAAALPCVTGSGEFSFRGEVDAHFSVYACLENETTGEANGHLQSGQTNTPESDFFHYNVHCMSVDKERGGVFLGAEIQQLSQHHATHQDPEAFRLSLSEGDPEIIREYEQKIHSKMMEHNSETYLPALLNLLEVKGWSLQQYEDFLQFGNNKKREEDASSSGPGRGGRRRLSKKGGKGGKGGGSEEDLLTEAGVLIGECAVALAEDYACGQSSVPMETEVPKFSGRSKLMDIAEDNGASEAEVFFYCSEIAWQICHYGCWLTDDCRRRRMEEEEEVLVASNGQQQIIEEDPSEDDPQGTLVLFYLANPNADENDHAIAVKLGHEFDTKDCAAFQKTIDYDFFDAGVIDKLTEGSIHLN